MRAACTPAAAASPTWSDLPSEPNAARSPPAWSNARRSAAPVRSSSSPSSRAVVCAAPAAPHTAVGCQPPSYSSCDRLSRPIASKPAAYASSTSPTLRSSEAPTAIAAGAVGALRWAIPGR